MKKILLFICLIIIAGCSKGQEKNIDVTTPSKLPIPAYRILTTDSIWATSANLKKNVPVIIIYFGSDCGHCQKMMYEMKPKLKELKNIQVVMITFSMNYDLRGIRAFKRDYGLTDQPNFTIGTEGYTMLVQKYYDIHTTPFIAMYDKYHRFTQSFDKVPKTEDILTGARKLHQGS